MRSTRKRSARQLGLAVLTVATALAAAPAARAVTVTINPSQDNTLYEDFESDASSGVGVNLYVGASGSGLRRAVVQFDVAGSVPAGATITGVTVRFNVNLEGPVASVANVQALHRLSATWGEAGSDAGLPGGMGGAAQAGDATWEDRFYSMAMPWTTAGGDFAAAASASTAPPASVPGTLTFASTAALVADVQAWLDTPASNHGWVLRGAESTLRAARRVDSREGATPPELEIDYTAAAAGGAGAVPDGNTVAGTQLELAKAGADLEFTWGASCRASDVDYALHEGQIGNWYSHRRKVCGTGGLTQTSFTLTPTSNYYLVTPMTAATEEGDFGVDWLGAPRPQGAPFCGAQNVAAPVCP